MPEFACPHPVTVEARLGSGAIEIHAEPRDTALVEVSPVSESASARDAASQTRIDFSGNLLSISGPESNGWPFRRSPQLRVTARVPAGSSGRIRVLSANIACHGDWDQISLNTASGDGYIEHVTGDLSVNSASGKMRAARVGGRLTVNSVAGAITAQQVVGSVDVKSASGDVDLGDLRSNLLVHTASGDVRIGAARQGTIRINSASGDVSVGVVAGTGVWLDLSSLSGRTRSDLCHGTKPAPADPTLTVQVRTMSGDIGVYRATAPAPRS